MVWPDQQLPESLENLSPGPQALILATSQVTPHFLGRFLPQRGRHQRSGPTSQLTAKQGTSFPPASQPRESQPREGLCPEK